MTKDPEDPYATPSDEVSMQMNITPTCVHGNIDISLGFCVSFTVTVNIHSFVVFYKNDDQPDGKILSAGLTLSRKTKFSSKHVLSILRALKVNNDCLKTLS